jgi:hypothetical protein
MKMAWQNLGHVYHTKSEQNQFGSLGTVICGDMYRNDKTEKYLIKKNLHEVHYTIISQI